MVGLVRISVKGRGLGMAGLSTSAPPGATLPGPAGRNPSGIPSAAGTRTRGASVSSGFPARQPLGGVPRSSGEVRVASCHAQSFYPSSRHTVKASPYVAEEGRGERWPWLAKGGRIRGRPDAMASVELLVSYCWPLPLTRRQTDRGSGSLFRHSDPSCARPNPSPPIRSSREHDW